MVRLKNKYARMRKIKLPGTITMIEQGIPTETKTINYQPPVPPLTLPTGITLKSRVRAKKTILTTSDIQSIIALHIDKLPVSRIAKQFKCSNGLINKVILSNADKIEIYRNQLNIELDKAFKSDVLTKRNEILKGITAENIESANLGMKTGSIVDLTKVDALINNKSTENIAINVNTASKEDLLSFIKGSSEATDNNIIQDESVEISK
jgi:DNA uptake protein ComE-like DNA-binding protein